MKLADQGMALRRIPYGDTSLVVHLFTRTRGRVALMVRGARTGKGGNGPTLAGFHTLDLFFTLRAGADLGHLHQLEIVRGRHRLLGDARAGAAALLLLEGLYRYLAPLDPHEDLYQEMHTAFDLLEEAYSPPAVAAVGLARLAQRVGYGWRLDGCAGCGDGEGLAYFSVKRCQSVCRRCGAPYVDRLIPVDEALAEIMRQLPWPGRECSTLDEKYVTLYRISRAVLERHGGKRLNADLFVPSVSMGGVCGEMATGGCPG